MDTPSLTYPNLDEIPNILSRYKVKQKVITIAAISSTREQMLTTDSGLRGLPPTPPPFPLERADLNVRD